MIHFPKQSTKYGDTEEAIWGRAEGGGRALAGPSGGGFSGSRGWPGWGGR